MSLSTVAAVVVAGGIAGCLGSLLGIGGGVFLVPFLNVGLGLEFKLAMAISLMTVIATSSVVSAGTAGRQLINLRLGMLLEIASSIGGLLAGITVHRLTNRTLGLWFAIVTAAIAVIMMSKRERRNVLDADVDPGTLGLGQLADGALESVQPSRSLAEIRHIGIPVSVVVGCGQSKQDRRQKVGAKRHLIAVEPPLALKLWSNDTC
jgi:uncharacterized membrane protein YfcA